MPRKFQVMVSVQNIYLKMDGKPKLMGYYQTFKIEADSPQDAKKLAIQKVKEDKDIEEVMVKEKQKNPPVFGVDEIFEVEEFDEKIEGDRTGRGFFPCKKWYEFWK